MKKLAKARRFIIVVIGSLPLLIALCSSQIVFAANPVYDISVKIVADRSAVRMGQNIKYTVTAKNLGPDDAYFVDVMHILPDQLRLVSLTCDKGTSPDTPFCEYSSLKAGETVVSVLVATPNSQASNRDRNLKVMAGISFEEVDAFDPQMSNNQASVSTKLVGKPKRP